MTDSDPTADPQDSALRPAASDLHPADPADDLTANTPARADGSDEGFRDDDTGVDDAADRPLPGDRSPGDGTVDAAGLPSQADALRTATHGRETAAARADLSDDRPTPTATPAD